MYDETLPDIDGSHLKQFLETAPSNPQALLLGVYLEEKEKWEEKLNTIKTYRDVLLDKAEKLEREMFKNNSNLRKLQVNLKNESGLRVSVLNFFFIKTKTQREFNKAFEKAHKLTIEMKDLGDEFISVSEEYEKTYLSPPDTTQYELAMIGNTLFKPR
jgi:hypothetical protein